jgi:hypothetical protein
MAVGLSVPYYHNLTNDEIIDRAILRYEIYMRYYSLNLWRINSPYNFTALGSAIVVPVWAYKSVEGLSPKQGGEDFYFLQKLRNFGELLNYLPEKVHPAARLSNRVAFGTGPALIKGTNNNWNSYPIYNSVFFDEILETYNNLDKLYVKDIQTPLIKFINNNSKNNVWDLLRKNYPDKEKFVKACHEKINALRILQYLKYRHNLSENISDENKLIDFFKKYFEDECYIFNDKLTHFSFENENIKNLDKMRNFLFIKEEQLQKGNLLAKNGIFVNN